MGTITINLTDDVEKVFRKKVAQIYGQSKGTLGRAIAEAIIEWTKKKEYLDRCMSLLEEGIDMGKLKYSSREELHERD